MATFTVDETVGSYRVKSDLTQLIPVTREWATNPVVTDVQFPLAYRYPYGDKAFFVDTANNARNEGYPYRGWTGNNLPLNINLVATTGQPTGDFTNISPAVARVFTYKLSDISATSDYLEEFVITPSNYQWQPGNGFDNKLTLNAACVNTLREVFLNEGIDDENRHDRADNQRVDNRVCRVGFAPAG